MIVLLIPSRQEVGAWRLAYGVNQESLLSPTLFKIYMKPVGKVIKVI